MFKDEPWTLDDEKVDKLTKRQKNYNKNRISNYIKERKSDLAISTARVLKLFELHKEKTFNTNQISEALGLSEGTVSSIMNRLITLGDINVVTMQRPHWAPVFQHAEFAPSKVSFTYKKKDPILNVMNIFEKDKNAIYTKAELLKKLACSDGMLTKSLQILLLKGDINYVGSEEGKAKYQHKDGSIRGIKISCEPSSEYTSLLKYLEEKELKERRTDIKKYLENVKSRLFYSSKGLTVEYLKEDLDKVVEKMNKKKFLGLF